MEQEPKYYTIDEVAEILKVHFNTVYAMIERKELAAVKVGSQWRIPATSLPMPTENKPTVS